MIIREQHIDVRDCEGKGSLLSQILPRERAKRAGARKQRGIWGLNRIARSLVARKIAKRRPMEITEAVRFIGNIFSQSVAGSHTSSPGLHVRAEKYSFRLPRRALSFDGNIAFIPGHNKLPPPPSRMPHRPDAERAIQQCVPCVCIRSNPPARLINHALTK